MLVDKIRLTVIASVLAGSTLTGAMVLARQQKSPETKIKSAELKGQVRSATVVEPTRAAGDSKSTKLDPKTRQVLEKLEEPIAMPFANATPLDDLLKYIRVATTTSSFAGVPIYVDPNGLMEAEVTPQSTIRMELEGLPLKRTLQLALAQLRLCYFVVDGMIYITAEQSETQGLPPAIFKPSPLMEKLAKVERGELTLNEMKELIQFMKYREVLLSKPGETGHQDIVTRSALLEAAPETSATSETARLVAETSEMVKAVRELVAALKAEKQAKK
jgi:hypothetical protein